jgi:gamma-glutamylcyclotransferase (GGCT)/AIG2-like uncharacterized protein YtfP
MKKRCPDSKFIKRAKLVGYKLIYDGYSKNWEGSVANIIPSRGDLVWGGLYEISMDDRDALDYFEGYPKSYDRKEFEVKDDLDKSYIAYVYFREGKQLGQPSAKYCDVIKIGSKDCGLPQDYMTSILPQL